MAMTEEAKLIVDTLRYCEESGARCGNCPSGHDKSGIPNCHSQSKIADLIESLSAQIEQVTRERDAAVEDMKIIRSCRQCKTWQEYFKDNGDVSPCEDCDMYSNWQWRGVEVEG